MREKIALVLREQNSEKENISSKMGKPFLGFWVVDKQLLMVDVRINKNLMRIGLEFFNYFFSASILS